MIYLMADSPALIRALAERRSLEGDPISARGETAAGTPTGYRGEDLRVVQVEHNGPRAAARLGFLLGRDIPAAPVPRRNALILVTTLSNLQHPRMVRDLDRGGEHYAATLPRDSSMSPISLRVLPDAPAGEAPDSAAADLAAAQARFTGQPEELASTSLMLWWLIAAARAFLEAEDIVTVVTPKPVARGLEESLQGIEELIDLLRRRGAAGPE